MPGLVQSFSIDKIDKVSKAQNSAMAELTLCGMTLKNNDSARGPKNAFTLKITLMGTFGGHHSSPLKHKLIKDEPSSLKTVGSRAKTNFSARA